MKFLVNFLFISFLFLITLHAFSLKDGFKLALENDMDYKVNKNNLKNIKYDQEIADSLFSPKLDFSATVESTKLTENKLTPGNSPYLKSDEYELTFTQPVFDGYESKYEKELQQNRFKSAIYYLKESKDKIALDYTESYINTLKEKDLLNLSMESIAISENIFNKVYKKVSAGYGTKLEFVEAKGNLVESKVNLNIQKINFKDNLENLKLYVQAEFDSTELTKPNFYLNLPKSLNDALNIAKKENPSINVSKANVHVSIAEEKKLNKEFYPNVNFTSSYTLNNAFYGEEDEDYNEYALGFELNYNLYNGGKDRAEKMKALQNI